MKTKTYKDLLIRSLVRHIKKSVMPAGRKRASSVFLDSCLRRNDNNVVLLMNSLVIVYKKAYEMSIEVYKMETQISISKDLGYLTELQYERLSGLNEEVSKLLGAMIRTMDGSR